MRVFSFRLLALPAITLKYRHLTSKQNGSVGGYMVKKMIEQQEKQMAEK